MLANGSIFCTTPLGPAIGHSTGRSGHCRTFLREPLGEDGSAGNIAPASPQEGFKAGAQTLHRMSWDRVQQRESNLTGNIANRIAQQRAAQQAVDPVWARDARAWEPDERQSAVAAVDSGQGYDIDQHAHDSALSVISNFEDRLPPGVKIGVLNRIEPTSDPRVAKGLFSDAPDFSNYVRRDFVSDAAAMWDPNTRRIMIAKYGTAPFRSFGHFSEGLQGEVHHEMAHAVSALDLTAPKGMPSSLMPTACVCRRCLIIFTRHSNAESHPRCWTAAQRLVKPTPNFTRIRRPLIASF